MGLTSSSLVKSQSHSAVSSIFRKKSKTGVPDDSPETVPEREEQGPRADMGGGLRRSTTQPLAPPADEDQDPSRMSIKERMAKLQQSGEIGWQKRTKRHTAAEEVSVVTTGNYLFNGAGDRMTASILESRRQQLDTAQEGWKARVQASDAAKFTVEGKMGVASPAPATPSGGRIKRSPKQARFRSKNLVLELHSSPCSPAVAPSLRRSLSAPGGDEHPDTPSPAEGPTVPVPRADDETFEAFFQSLAPQLNAERMEINVEDLDFLQRSDSGLLVQKRIVQVQRRRRTTRNPVKSLALRADLMDEYMEVKTGIAERELRRLKLEKLSRGTSLAVEALAGLASNEDFTAVNLRKHKEGPEQYPETMLLRVKGRRHVETRLVEPVPASVNKGDCYLLVTRTMLALYMGELSNVVERARAKEVAARVEAGDLACSASRTSSEGRFWSALGGEEALDAGPPDEDERVEAALIATNMIYELTDHELVPVTSAWGTVPKVELLQPNKNLVFDFGSEMYVWSGKSAGRVERREAVALARELWDEGYDYAECDWSPLGPLQGERPPWALFCKIAQNMEPVLFREKFQDWPDEALKKRHIGVSEPDGSNMMAVHACDAEAMRRDRVPWPDQVLEGTHLGRGVNYLDEETRRVSEVSDVQLTVWRVSEFEHCEVTDAASLGQFKEDESYVIRWHYSVAVTVRGLNGAPSKHSAPGRDRCAYFLWHGRRSPPGDRGAAGLLTVELNVEKAPTNTVDQLSEPPAFLRLFNAALTVHRASQAVVSLYLVRGSVLPEAMLLEVDAEMRSLRSRACFVLVDRSNHSITLWSGSQASAATKEMARSVAEKVRTMRPQEFRLPGTAEIAFIEECEGSESEDFLSLLKGSRDDYYSLVDRPLGSKAIARLFHFASTTGEFAVQGVESPLLHPESSSPYLFLQSDLYSASQPALFLLDTGDRLWLWHGWVEEETAPSAVVRHQAERRAAMQTAIQYWELEHGDEPVRGSLVWAGLEPLHFTALFPFWEPRDDVAERNAEDTNRLAGEVVDMKTELERLMCTCYPLHVLLQRPLPDGVDPTLLEDYLEPDAFPEVFDGLSKEEFFELPSWKKNTLKKDVGLF